MILPTDFQGWGFGPWLVRNTSNYYLAMDAYLEAENQKHPDRAEMEKDWRSLARNMAEKISQYLTLASGGEMRHCRGFKGGERYYTWSIVVFALNGQPDAFVAGTLDKWGSMFTNRYNFKGGYGGKPWAQACTITAEWLRGDCSDVMFVELALNLHHNNSCIFNKLSLAQSTYQAILNAGGAESESLRRQLWPVILKTASPEWRTRWGNLLGSLKVGDAVTEPDTTFLAPDSAQKAATAVEAMATLLTKTAPPKHQPASKPQPDGGTKW